LVLSRQNLPFQTRDTRAGGAIKRGGYILVEASAPLQAVIIATGSEVGPAVEAQGKLAASGVAARVVSMPATEVFDRQDQAYRESVIPSGVPCIAVEAGVTDGWRKYVGTEGAVIGLDRFGASAPAGELFKLFGFTPERIAAVTASLLAARVRRC
jgi:transketolase